MVDLVTDIRSACARVAVRARHVSIDVAAIPAYAASLPLGDHTHPAGPAPAGPGRERLAARTLTLDAINFGSGWFPTLRKPAGRSGFDTVAAGIDRLFDIRGGWRAEELQTIGAAEVADMLTQDPEHELMGLFAAALNDLGRHVEAAGSFSAIVDEAGGSAVAVASLLAGWDSFADVSTYDGEPVPFYKRAQIAAADLTRAGIIRPNDYARLTMFADNLVPHVLRLDGILEFEPELSARIERGEPIEHGSPEEVEIRACALQAVELIVQARAEACAAQVDELLWNRGRGARYKASPRHRSRTTAY